MTTGPIEAMDHDVVIVGGGAAGLRAAIAVAEASTDRRPLSIAIVSKVYPMRSHTGAAEGGAAGALREYDSFDLHAEDTIRGSDYLADQDVVEAFVRDAPQELIQLEHWGCPWNREPDGRMAVRAFGGMSVQRTVFASDKTGFHMLHALFQTTLKYPVIVRYDEWYVIALLVQDGGVEGLVAMERRTGAFRMITARAVIIATGGIGRVFPFTTNGAANTGDGMALAYRAGAPLKDMEFVQYHPTGLPGTGILITEASRGEGGYLLNAEGERFLARYFPQKMELSPRDLVSRAIITELEAGKGFGGPEDGYVHLDLRHLGREKLEERLPFVLELARTFVRIDPVTQPIPVRPVVHYMMGGIHTDIQGRSPLKGLYACGEAASVTINGSNRLGSNSLTECLVFGARAGRAAAEDAAERPAPASRDELASAARREVSNLEERLLKGKGRERAADLHRELRQAMERGAGVYRNEQELSEARERVRELKDRARDVGVQDTTRTFNVELVSALELNAMMDVAEAILCAALERRESRGAHARRDFPQRNDQEYLTHFLVWHTPDGPRLERSPVSITRWQPAERKY